MDEPRGIRRPGGGTPLGAMAPWRQIVIVTWCMALATTALAQPIVTPGGRIRLVQVDSGKVDYVGTFMRRSGDTLILRNEAGVVRTIAMSRYRVELGGGRHHHILRGAVLGAGSGLVIGLVADARADAAYRTKCWKDAAGGCRNPDRLIDNMEIALGAASGTIIGGLIGRVSHERWTPVGIQRQVSLAPTRGVWRLGFVRKF